MGVAGSANADPRRDGRCEVRRDLPSEHGWQHARFEAERAWPYGRFQADSRDFREHRASGEHQDREYGSWSALHRDASPWQRERERARFGCER